VAFGEWSVTLLEHDFGPSEWYGQLHMKQTDAFGVLIPMPSDPLLTEFETYDGRILRGLIISPATADATADPTLFTFYGTEALELPE